jgi:hypothetical protein
VPFGRSLSYRQESSDALMLTTTQVQLRLLRPYVEGCVINSARFKFRNWKWHLPASLKGRIKRGREGVWAEVRLEGLKGQFVGWSNAGFRLERVTEPPGMRMIIHARLLPNHRPSVRVRTDQETELMYLILYLRRTRLIMRQCTLIRTWDLVGWQEGSIYTPRARSPIA